MAPTPLQAKKIQEHQVSTNQEILEVQVRRGPYITPEDKARKDALTLTLYQLPILMHMEETSNAIHKIMGTKNVVSIWYHKHNGVKHNGSANVVCLNPYVYRKFLNKEEKIGPYHVEFTPHRKNLEGSEKPIKDMIEKFGFEDTNVALVNTVEALQNQTQGTPSATKEDIVTIMNEAIENGNIKLKQEIHMEMENLKQEIVKEAHLYADDIMKS